MEQTNKQVQSERELLLELLSNNPKLQQELYQLFKQAYNMLDATLALTCTKRSLWDQDYDPQKAFLLQDFLCCFMEDQMNWPSEKPDRFNKDILR